MRTLKGRLVVGFLVGLLATGVGLAIASDGTPPSPSAETEQAAESDDALDPSVVIDGSRVGSGTPVEEDMEIGTSSEPVPQVEVDYCTKLVADATQETAEVVFCRALLAKAEGKDVPPGKYTTEEMEALLAQLEEE